MLRVLMVSCLWLASNSLWAEAMTGLQVVEKAKQNGAGFEDLTQEVKMILMDKKGDTTERDMLLKAMTDSNGKSYSMSIFTAPKREKGIALLTVNEADSDSKQYLYLPSSRRVKRITSSNSSSSFRGSDFTFEDLSEQRTEDYRFEMVKKAPCGELECYVVDRFPKEGLESSYSKTELWIDSTHYRPMKAMFYDKDGALLKTMETSGYTLYQDKLWNPKQILMKNNQEGTSTEMQSIKTTINSGLKASEFTELAMRNFR